MLEAYSFENVLQRGFAVVRDDKGRVITDATNTNAGQTIELQFKDKKFVSAEVRKK